MPSTRQDGMPNPCPRTENLVSAVISSGVVDTA